MLIPDFDFSSWGNSINNYTENPQYTWRILPNEDFNFVDQNISLESFYYKYVYTRDGLTKVRELFTYSNANPYNVRKLTYKQKRVNKLHKSSRMKLVLDLLNKERNPYKIKRGIPVWCNYRSWLKPYYKKKHPFKIINIPIDNSKSLLEVQGKFYYIDNPYKLFHVNKSI